QGTWSNTSAVSGKTSPLKRNSLETRRSDPQARRIESSRWRTRLTRTYLLASPQARRPRSPSSIYRSTLQRQAKTTKAMDTFSSLAGTGTRPYFRTFATRTPRTRGEATSPPRWSSVLVVVVLPPRKSPMESRSEERRVGKECRERGGAGHYRKE